MSQDRWKAAFDALEVLIRSQIPGFEVRYKTDSQVQLLLGKLLRPFNPTYLTRFTSTLYPLVWFPSRSYVETNYREAFCILAHEFVHLRDWQDRRLGFPLTYLMPQILALGALAALGAFFWLPCLTALVFLAALYPWASRGRTRAELRGYTMSMAIPFWLWAAGTRPPVFKPGGREWLVQIFTGTDYFRMSRTGEIGKDLDQMQFDILQGLLLDGTQQRNAPYLEVHTLLVSLGLIDVP